MRRGGEGGGGMKTRQACGATMAMVIDIAGGEVRGKVTCLECGLHEHIVRVTFSEVQERIGSAGYDLLRERAQGLCKQERTWDAV